MRETLPLLLDTDFPAIKRTRLETLQVNLGYICNQSCFHCHVNAGPNRKEQMSQRTIDDIITFLKTNAVNTLDLTGGAPELNPSFRYLVESASKLGVHVIDRCNLTILNEKGQEDLAEFLANNQVEIIASLPCYLQENVEKQRGQGVYTSSIKSLKTLNQLGYGKEGTGLELNLMYNPLGPYLPPPQEALEQDYKKALKKRFDISFNKLYALNNMPIMRFGSTLLSKGEFDTYMRLLKEAYQDTNLETLMCRSQISVDWQGYVYDCDFNQMLKLPLLYNNKPQMRINKLEKAKLENNSISVADHCYGCTAGNGSSCTGSLT